MLFKIQINKKMHVFIKRCLRQVLRIQWPNNVLNLDPKSSRNELETIKMEIDWT